MKRGGQRGVTETGGAEIHVLWSQVVPHRGQRYIHRRGDDLKVVGMDSIHRHFPEEGGESKDEDRCQYQGLVQCGP